MSHHRLLTLSALTALATPLAAQFTPQITYVDADVSTNTTLADGSPYVPAPTTDPNDNQWAQRAFANGGTIYSSHDSQGNEDAPMLRTTISGLIPGLEYMIYSYWWSDLNGWRGRGQVDTSQPAPQIPGYNTVHFATSAFAPMVPMTFDATVGFEQVTLGLQYDASGFETSGHFANQVLVAEGNRRMYSLPLGTHLADANGEIQVYVDDLEGLQHGGNRTWYDGVGWEIAPFQVGQGCGNPLPQMGYVGQPLYTQEFQVTVANAPPGALAALAIGFSATTWNAVPLPFPLDSLGFPGCFLNVSPDFNQFLLTDPVGAASFSLTPPSLPPITLYWQWGVLGGPTGLVMTPGLETKFHP